MNKDGASEPLVRAVGLYKSYDPSTNRRVDVLKGVDLQIQKGEFTVILGPSGTGKSTLLHLLALLERPDHGEVWFANQRVSALPEAVKTRIRNQRIGLLFQFFHLLGDLTAVENVLLPARIRAVGWRGEQRRKAESLLEILGLTDRRDHLPSELSGGEMQRVALARAIMNDPDLLMCDEPTGNLDRATGARLIHYLSELKSQFKKTILIVTHDDRIAEIADRILYLEDGLLRDRRTARAE